MIQEARHCLGTPWKHQGRVPGQHLDCVGLVRYAAIAAGVLAREVDFTTYGRLAQPELMRAKLREHFDQVWAMQPGSVLWLKFNNEPMHLAIYTEDNTLIHAVSTGPGCVVEHGFRYPWPKRVHQILEWKGLDDV